MLFSFFERSEAVRSSSAKRPIGCLLIFYFALVLFLPRVRPLHIIIYNLLLIKLEVVYVYLFIFDGIGTDADVCRWFVLPSRW